MEFFDRINPDYKLQNKTVSELFPTSNYQKKSSVNLYYHKDTNTIQSIDRACKVL